MRVLLSFLLCALASHLVGAVVSYNITGYPSYGTPPEERYGYCAVYDPSTEMVILFGGANLRTSFNDVYLYNMTSDRWAIQGVIGDPPSPRSYHACSLLDGRLYVFGGITDQGAVGDMLSLSLTEWTWSEELVLGSIKPGPRFYHSMVTVEALPTSLIIHGGISQLGPLSDFFRYDISTQKFTQLTVDLTGGTLARLSDFNVGMVADTDTVVYLSYNPAENTVHQVTFNTTHAVATEIVPEPSSPTRIPMYIYASVLYGDEVFMMFGWSDVYNENYNTLWIFNMTSRQWRSDDRLDTSEARDSTSAVLVMHYVFVFGGWGDQITNEVILFDLLSPVAAENAYSITQSPSPRAYHASCRVGSVMYVIGGIGSDGPLNDVWAFNLTSLTWSQLNVGGMSPSPRHSHSATGIGQRIIIIGGQEEDQLSSEVWEFNLLSFEWRLMASSNNMVPVAGHSALPLESLGVIFVAGGYDLSGDRSEAFVLDFTTYQWTAVTQTPVVPFIIQPFSYAGSAVVGEKVYLVGGKSNAVDLSAIVEVVYDITTNTATYQDVAALATSVRSPAVASLGDNIIIASGSFYQNLLRVVNDAHVPTVGAPSVNTVPLPDTYLQRSAGSAVSIASTVILFGGLASVQGSDIVLPTYYTNDVFLVAADAACQASGPPAADDCVQCSAGTTNVDGTVCLACEAGSYNPTAGSAECFLCPPGYFSGTIAATSPLTCIPCQAGTYSPLPGSAACLPCDPPEACGLGAQYVGGVDSLSSNTETGAASTLRAIQPVEARSYRSESRLVNTVVISVLGSMFIIVNFLYLVSNVCLPRTLRLWGQLDLLFYLTHLPKLHQPIFNQKTNLGGFFTTVAIVVALFTTSQIVVPIYYQNTVETRTIVPNELLTYTIATDLTVTFELGSYGGPCEDESVTVVDIVSGEEGPGCAPDNTVLLQEGKFVFVGKTAGATTRCSRPSNNPDICTLTWSCFNCSLPENSGEIEFSFLGPGSFASYILWNVTTTTGMPARISSFADIIEPEVSQVFRGTTVANYIDLSVIPLLYRILFNETLPTSGFVLSYGGTAPGSQVAQESFHSTNGFRIVLGLEKTASTVDVQIDTQIKIAVVAAAILGGVSAVIGGVGFVMKNVESFYPPPSFDSSSDDEESVMKKREKGRGADGIELGVFEGRRKKRGLTFSVNEDVLFASTGSDSQQPSEKSVTKTEGGEAALPLGEGSSGGASASDGGQSLGPPPSSSASSSGGAPSRERPRSVFEEDNQV